MPSWYICGNERFSGPASGVLLLDVLSATAIFAVSTRKLRTAYAGPALKVTTSAGSTTQDIGFTVNNDLDTSALASFIGSNSGTINTWYDQVGSNNLFNPTVSGQPTIVNSGTNVTQNGHVWAAGTSATSIGNSLSQAQPYSVAFVARGDVLGTTFIGSGFQGNHLNILDNSSNWLYVTGGSTLGGPTSDTAIHTFVCILNSPSSRLFVDGTQSGAGGDCGSDSVTGFSLGDGSNNWHIAEVIFFSGVLGSPDQALIKASWETYWGVP